MFGLGFPEALLILFILVLLGLGFMVVWLLAHSLRGRGPMNGALESLTRDELVARLRSAEAKPRVRTARVILTLFSLALLACGLLLALLVLLTQGASVQPLRYKLF